MLVGSKVGDSVAVTVAVAVMVAEAVAEAVTVGRGVNDAVAVGNVVAVTVGIAVNVEVGVGSGLLPHAAHSRRTSSSNRLLNLSIHPQNDTIRQFHIIIMVPQHNWKDDMGGKANPGCRLWRLISPERRSV